MAEVITEAATADEAAPELRADSVSLPRGRSPIELFAAGVALLIPIASPGGLIGAEAWSGRAIILLVVVAVGLPILWSEARRRSDLGARAAVAFLLIGMASTVLSRNHTTAIFGLYNQGTGLLFMASLAGAWAIGRTIRPEARPLLELALIGGVLINAGVALIASVVDLSSLSASLVDASGRSSALTGNPVHLGALAVLGLALSIPRFAATPAKWAIPVIAIAATAQLSGTRLTLVVMGALLVWAAHRHGVRLGGALVVVVLLGLGAGSVIGRSGSGSATGRAGQSEATASWSVRPTTWLSARHAIAGRPFLGIGPGQFRTATSPSRPDSVGRLEGTEKLFTDAHNLFVEYATTTGLLGVTALLIWLVAATRRAEGYLLAGALALLAIHMFEPQSVVTTPLAFLALGGSASHGVLRPRSDRRARNWIVSAGAIGIAMSLATLFFLGEFDLRQAQLDLRLAPARQANQLLPAWPATATIVGRVWLLEAILGRNEADYQQARSWRLVAVQRDNTDPGLWNDLAELDEVRGLNKEASVEFLSAVRNNPTSARAMGGLARLAHARCDSVQERYWTERAVRVSPPVAASPAARARPSPPAPGCTGN